MLELELISLDKSISFEKLKLYFFLTAKGFVKRLSLPSGLINVFPEVKPLVELVSLVDFPDGLQSSQLRLAETLYSIRSGVKYVDLVVSNNLIADCNINKIKSEFKTSLELCKRDNVKLRPVLEYRLHDIDVLLKICEQLAVLGVTDFVSATGRLTDDFNDNLLFCKELQDTLGVSAVFCGRLLYKSNYLCLKAAGIKCAKVATPAILENLIGQFDLTS